MKIVYYVRSNVGDPLDKDFIAKTRKIKSKMLKDGFLGERDAVLFVPTDKNSYIEVVEHATSLLG
jgi:hypothetical protein